MELKDASLLVVEDSPEYTLLVKKALGESYSHVYVESLQAAREALAKEQFDLVLLDVMLPDGDGFQFFVEIKNQEPLKSLPVIFLTSRAEVSDRVMGLSLGATDYIVKPFDVMELRARVLNKVQFPSTGGNSGQMKYSALSLDLSTYKIKAGNEFTNELSPLEVKLLSYLMKNKERVLSRQQILEGVWGNEVHVLDRTVDSAVAGLRKKLGECSSYIRSIHGVGYMLSDETSAKKSG